MGTGADPLTPVTRCRLLLGRRSAHMILHWLTRCWAIWFGTPYRRPRPESFCLAFVTLEGRTTPSVTTSIYVDQSPDMVFDFMTFHREKPDRWAVDLERRDGPGEAS